MADGYGYAAEGDTNTATLMCAAQTLIGDAHFSEMYAMDWELDSVLISHMGEGNWKIARQRPAGAADRPAARDRAARQPADAGVLAPSRGARRRRRWSRSRASTTGSSSGAARCSTRPSCRRSRCTTSTSGPTGGWSRSWTSGSARRAPPLRHQPRRPRRPLAAARRAARPRVRGDLSSDALDAAARAGAGGEPGAARARLVTLTWGNVERDRPRRRAGGDQAERGRPTTRCGRRTSWSSTSTATSSRASGGRRPTRRRTWRCTARSSRSAGSCTRTRRGRRRGRRRSARSRCSARRTPTCAPHPIPLTRALTEAEIDADYEGCDRRRADRGGGGARRRPSCRARWCADTPRSAGGAARRPRSRTR